VSGAGRALRRRAALAGLAAGAALAACRDAPPPARFAELTYAHRGALRFAAARVDVASEYNAPLAPPHVEHLAPIAPEAALRRWAADRLAADGAPARVVRFAILDARIVETGQAGGLERLDAALAAAVEIRPARGGAREAFAEARATAWATVPEDASLAARERALHELVERAMNEFDAEVERQVRAHLARFLAG
jgi:hypothetical protein